MAASSSSKAAGENYDTALEVAYVGIFHSVNENRLAGSPLEAEFADGIDSQHWETNGFSQ